MSTARTLVEEKGRAVWKLERDAEGRPLCRWCKKPVPPPKRTFCSDDCVHEWRIRNSTSYAREAVAKRDKGICAKCGTSTYRLSTELQMQRSQTWALSKSEDRIAALRAWQARIRDLVEKGYSEHRLLKASEGGSLWDMDHVVPVIEGGGTCGLENYRTLCIPCHKGETKKLAGRRAQARRQSSP